MRRFVTGCLFLFATFSFAQNKATIDSINATPFNVKIEKAGILDKVFLKNAAHARQLNYTLGEAMSYSNLSLVYYYQGKYNLQVENSLKAIQLFEKINAADKLAYEYAGLGYSMKRRNMRGAMHYMRKGKKIAEENHDTLSFLSIYNNYGVLKEMVNELDSALYFYNKGLVYKKAVNDSIGIPYSLNNIAGIFVMKKKYQQAEKLYEQALQMRTDLDDGIGIAENYSYFGDLYFAQKQYGKSLDFYQKSLQKAQQYNYIDLIQNNYKNISKNYELLGNQKLALENYKNYTQYKDSILNRETNSKIAELEVLFETNKKEKLLAEHKNLLLQKEAEARNKNNVLLMLSLLSFFLALIGWLIYRQQKLKHRQLEQQHELKTAIAHIETQNKLHEQRLGISRDLHDNIGAQLTFIISSVDNIKYAFDLKDSKLDRKLQSISTFTKDTILELRDTIWAMNTSDITFEDLRARILNFVEKAKNAKESIKFIFTIDDDLSQIKLSSVTGMNIYRTVQEAVNNAIKSSHAEVVEINVRNLGNQIEIVIHDNGVGFEPNHTEQGNGLKNMEKRMAEIGASLIIASSLGQGTEVTITINKQQ